MFVSTMNGAMDMNFDLTLFNVFPVVSVADPLYEKLHRKGKEARPSL